jgi:hypothetical protein
MGEDQFPVQGGQMSSGDFAARIKNYEKAMEDVLRINVLLGRWAEESQQTVARQVVNVLAGQIEARGGLTLYLALRSFPMLLAMYAGGIGAIEGDNYRTLQTLFTTQVPDHRRGGSKSVLESTVEAILDVDRTDAFKTLPDFDNKYVPRSEYLFTTMQPFVEDILLLGNRYEDLFDRFELFYALCYADLTDNSWGPPGRFAWKYRNFFSRTQANDPYSKLVEEAKREGERWGPLRAAMFRGSAQRFLQVAEKFKTGLLDELPWR